MDSSHFSEECDPYRPCNQTAASRVKLYPELNGLERTMLAKPEWNPERYEAPKKSQADFHMRHVDRYLMIATFAAGTSLLVVGLLAMN
jgi:hypothetical protein